MTKALVPGSFDPITVGHLNIITRAAKMFDTVYVTVFVNSDKTPRFTHENRVLMIKAACQDLSNVKVSVDHGMLADYCKKNEIRAVVKGVRNNRDFEYEKKMAEFNRERNPEMDTLILFPDKNLEDVSSTRLCELLKSGKNYEYLIPEKALPILNTLLAKKQHNL